VAWWHFIGWIEIEVRTMTDHRDVIAAFADQEPVDAEALSAALADTDAREYLIDILLLRGMVAGEPGTRNLEPRNRAARNRAPRNRVLAAAAFVVIGLGAGFLASRVMDRNGDSTAPPDAITASPDASANSTSAPTPTHVIRMENGVEWNERSGGK
jgi:hypothetical protein